MRKELGGRRKDNEERGKRDEGRLKLDIKEEAHKVAKWNEE